MSMCLYNLDNVLLINFMPAALKAAVYQQKLGDHLMSLQLFLVTTITVRFVYCHRPSCIHYLDIGQIYLVLWHSQ